MPLTALTETQQQFLNAYVRKRTDNGKKKLSRGSEKKTKLYEQLSLLSSEAIAVFGQLDPSSPSHSTLQTETDNVAAYIREGVPEKSLLKAGINYATKTIERLKAAQKLHPLKLQPVSSKPLRQVTDVPVESGVTLDELKALLERAKALESGARSAGLTPAALIVTAIKDGNELVGKAPTTPIKVPAPLAELMAVEQDARGFISKWRQCGVTEQQARKALPPHPGAIFNQIADAFDVERQQIGNAFETMTDAGAAAGLAPPLDELQQKYQRRRTTVLGTVDGVARRIGEARSRLTELSQSKLYELGPARQMFDKAQALFANAKVELDLDAVLAALETFDTNVSGALERILPQQREALETFQKRRHELSEQILKAQRVRGALVGGSPVKMAVDEVIEQRRLADEAMAKAVTTGQAEAATLLLEAALKRKIDSEAEKLSKEEKEAFESDTKALPKYQKAFDELVETRAALALLPGATKQLNALDELIAQTRVDGSGRPTVGFAKALELIEAGGVSKLAQEADVASKHYLNDSLDDFTKAAFLKAKGALDRYGRFHGTAAFNLQREVLAQTANQQPATSALTKLAERLDQDTDKQIEQEKALRETFGTVQHKLEHLEAWVLPKGDPGLEVMRKQLGDAEAALKAWRPTDAGDILDALATDAQDAQDDHQGKQAEWQRLAKAHQALKERAEQCKATGFGVVHAEGKAVADDIERFLNAHAAGQLDLDEALASGPGAIERMTARLDKALRDSHVDLDSFDGDAFQREADTLNKAAQREIAAVRERIKQLNEALIKADLKKGADSTRWPAILKQLEDEWNGTLGKGVKLESGQSHVEALRAAQAMLLTDLKLLTESLPDPKAPGSQAFKQAVETGKGKELKAARRHDFETAQSLLLQFEAAGIEPPPNALADLGTYDENATEAQAKKWTELVGALALRQAEHEKQLKERRVPNQKKLVSLKGETEKKLIALPNDVKERFPGFFKGIEDQLKDAEAMLAVEPPDAALIQAAEQQIAAITRLLSDAKGKGEEGTVTFKRVWEVVAELNGLLGKGNVVLNRMPETHKQLKGQLDQATALAQRSAPDVGLAALEKLRGPILDASQRAQQLQLQYEGFKARRKEVEAKFKQMQKHTGTTLGDRTKAYMARFEARVNEAHALARQEAGVEAGLKQLAALDKELSDMLAKSPEAAKEDVLALDVQAENEQRELRDMARTFNATLANWTDILLPEVRKAVLGRDEELGEYDSLEAAVKNVGKTVEPYLAVISKLPHRRAKANGAPEMQAVRTAFSQAYLRLGQLNRTAVRLRDGAGSTNVDLVSDLKKLEADWVKRCQDAEQALNALNGRLKDLPGSAVTDEAQQDSEDYLPEPAVKTLVTAVETLDSMLTRMGTHFKPSAFDAPLKVLASATATPQGRKKAREEALRTTRQLAADVADNPLFQKIFEGARTGKLEPDIRPQIAFLRAALKKIELAALVGI